jgi:hypothetical protein
MVFLFMIPFLLSLALFFLLNKKLESKNWFIEFAKDYFFIVLLAFIILLAAFLFVTILDLNFIETIYCEGVSDSVSNTNQPTNLNSLGNIQNIPSNSPDTISNTNSSKIQIDSDKYYHVRKDSVDKGVEIISKGLELVIEKLAAIVGAAPSAGTAAATVLKSNFPLGPKLAIAGASAVVVGATTKIGIAIGEAVVTKSRVSPSTDGLNKIEPDRIPSPT